MSQPFPAVAALSAAASLPAARAALPAVLAGMSVAEKVHQLTSVWDAKASALGDDGRVDPQRLQARFPLGLGHVARPSDRKGEGLPFEAPGRGPRETAALVQALQQHALHHTRLGIPVLCHEEGLHGYAAQGATCFPQAIALAGSFDTAMVEAVNTVTAQEMRARGVVLALNPVLDTVRDPRWGRTDETFGEDPHLAAEMGLAALRGLQGPPQADGRLPPGRVWATLKHLAGHGLPESGTNTAPAALGERELREQCLWPFERAVREGGAVAVMASYNEIDGRPSHANDWLLRQVLRDEWGFDGVVLGDYFAVEQLASQHRVAADGQAAAVLALQAGVDMDLPHGAAYAHLVQAVTDGQVPEALLDETVARVLLLKWRSGLFDPTTGDPDLDQAEALTHRPDAVALALRAAERSIVLLKNEPPASPGPASGAAEGMARPLLPLALPSAESSGAAADAADAPDAPDAADAAEAADAEIGPRQPVWAVIGPNAAQARLGGYAGAPPKAWSLLDGLQAVTAGRVQLRHAPGVRLSEGAHAGSDEVRPVPAAVNAALIDEAEQLARGSDLVILALGDDDRTCREAWSAEHLGDRSSLDLVGDQGLLLARLHATGRPLVVVLIGGRPVASEALVAQATALVQAWTLGEQGGLALARMLTGAVNPAARLPLTVPRHVGQLPAHYNHRPSARRGYLFDDIRPLFPFGFGLSYTRFEWGPPSLVQARIAVGQPARLQVQVRNVGDRDGDEVVQVYVRDRVASVTRPVLALCAFARVALQAGQARTVGLDIPAQALSLRDRQMQRVVEPGEFELLVGPDSQRLHSVLLQVD